MALNKERLDKSIPIPLYYQLKEILLNYVRQNKIKAGEPIPPEIELANMFNVSRPTVRKAIRELVNLGYLKRIQGKGTFVAKPKIHQEYTKRIISFNDEMMLKGFKPSTKVLNSACIRADELIADKLDLATGEKVFHLKRLRFIDNEPIVVLNSFIPLREFPGIEEEDFVNKSLYGIFKVNYNILIKRAIRSIEVMLATSTDAKLLGIKEGEPIHYFTTTVFNQFDTAVEYSLSRFRGDRSKFILEIIED